MKMLLNSIAERESFTLSSMRHNRQIFLETRHRTVLPQLSSALFQSLSGVLQNEFF